MSRIRRLRTVVVLLTLVSVVLPMLVHAAEDTTPPVLAALTLPFVETGPNGVDAVVRAVITDDGSGVTPIDCAGTATSAVAVRSPSGGVSAVGTFATRVGDEYRATVHLPRYAQAGRWTVERVVLGDCAGNHRSLETADLAAAGFATQLLVGGEGDGAPPVLRQLTISPFQVNVSADEVEVRVRARIGDGLAGVAALDVPACGVEPDQLSTVTFVAPTSGRRVMAAFRWLALDDYEARISVPRWAESGTWSIEWLVLRDCAHNESQYGGAALAASGLASSFAVQGTSDTTAPLVTTLALAPDVVDTRASGADVVVTATITDDVSGVSTINTKGCDRSPSRIGTRSPSGDGTSAPFLASSTAGVYRATLTLPRFAEPGTWTLELVLGDCAENYRLVQASDLGALGLPDSFRVGARLYDFGGFAAPLAGNALAERKAGSAMPVRFTLGGAAGADVFAPGFPQVQELDCATRHPLAAAVPLTATEWQLQGVEGDLHHYKWKSSPHWRDSCRRLILGFDDGSHHSADARFR